MNKKKIALYYDRKAENRNVDFLDDDIVLHETTPGMYEKWEKYRTTELQIVKYCKWHNTKPDNIK